MEIQYATDSDIVTTFSSTSGMRMQPIISAKEARKLLGKELSNTIDDVDLMEVVSLMSNLTEVLLEQTSVPQKAMASV